MLSARALNRATLRRQLLSQRSPVPVPDAVRQIIAVQAQSPPSPYLSLWNRVAGFDAADLDAAFADHTVVKASLMRVTLHAVHADDYPAFRGAMVDTLRSARYGDPRFAASGLRPADVDALLPHLLEYAAEARTAAQLQALLAEHAGDDAASAWWAFRTMAPLLHAPVGGAWSFRDRPSFVASPHETGSAEDGLRTLIRRYLEGFGPATPADFSRFTRLGRVACRPAWQSLAAELVELDGPDGVVFDVPDAPRPDEDEPAPPRLLGMWDSILLAYQDTTRIVPAEYRTVVTRINGDVLPTLLVDGFVAGVWRPIEHGIEVSAFRQLPKRVWSAIAAEAASLRAFLADREPLVYRRYWHWWARGLRAVEVRVLGS